MAHQEQPGLFYLGRPHALATGKTQTEALLYDSRDLTTHAVCVGMTGSGKTGLCITLLEEAALNGIPAIAIDPKGDLGNLLLAFPNLQPSDFRPWIDTAEAGRQSMSPDEFAAKQAWSWRNGLAKWDQTPERIGRFCEAVERVIFTPGSSAGIPITVLKSFHAPPAEIVGDTDAFTEQIAAAVSGLLALLGIDADPIRSREHIFLSRLLEASWRSGNDLDLHQLIQQIQRPQFDRVGAVDVESFFPADDRHKLAMNLNNLLASPAFASWTVGVPLDVQKLLYSPQGKPRLAIISIAHLDDAQRMFFVTMLLNEVVSWVRTQPGTSSLRALLYMDEVFGYFPPLSNPPSKRPMLTLMKQARAYGLGCVLATQNPVDLDYKGLSNAGTWFLGRLQTERDKARVMEGLEGASAEAGASFNRQQMEARLAALGSRVFLMNNVHNDAPIVFHTRWAMSYLCGPLTRGQIKSLMDPIRPRFEIAAPLAQNDGRDGDAAAGAAVTPPHADGASRRRPILPAGISERFAAIDQDPEAGYQLEYRPALAGAGKVHFVQASHEVDEWRDMLLLQPARESRSDDVWKGAIPLAAPLTTSPEPIESAFFAELVPEWAQDKSYQKFRRELAEHLYRTASLQLWQSESLGLVSRPGEPEAGFRDRVKQAIEARRQAERDRIEQQFAGKLANIEGRIEAARVKVSTQKWQFWTRATGLFWAAAEAAMRLKGAGRSGRPRSATTAMRGMATERGQQLTAQANLDKLLAEKDALEASRDEQLHNADAKFDGNQIALNRTGLKPRKADIEVDSVTLVWLPWQVAGNGAAEPLFQVNSPRAAAEFASHLKPSQPSAASAGEPVVRG